MEKQESAETRDFTQIPESTEIRGSTETPASRESQGFTEPGESRETQNSSAQEFTETRDSTRIEEPAVTPGSTETQASPEGQGSTEPEESRETQDSSAQEVTETRDSTRIEEPAETPDSTETPASPEVQGSTEPEEPRETQDSGAIEYLARLSHDLRAPVHSLQGYIGNLEDGVRGELLPAQRSDLERMRRISDHLLTMIEDVLAYNTLERGELRLALAEVRLSHVIAELEMLAQPQLNAKALEFDGSVCEHCETVVRADPKRLMQVLTNLLTNAIKFTPDGGRITLTCSQRAGEPMAEVRVTDTGPGIPPQHAEAIFRPYVRLDGDPPGTWRGVGLGLAISRDLCRAMGGELTVASTPGAGATFILTIPRA